MYRIHSEARFILFHYIQVLYLFMEFSFLVYACVCVFLGF